MVKTYNTLTKRANDWKTDEDNKTKDTQIFLI